MEAVVFTETLWGIISNDKYSMVEHALQLAIDAQDSQQALARTPVGIPSVRQLPGSPSLKLDLQTRESVTLGFHLALLNQVSDIDCTPNYTYLQLMICTDQGKLADGGY